MKDLEAVTLAVARQQLAAEPDSAERHVAVANAFAALRNPLAAIPHYEIAVSLAPRRVDWHCNLSMLLSGVGRHAEALEHAEKALAIDPDCFSASYNQAISLMALGRPRVAAERLLHCTRLQPLNPRAYNNLGLALAADRQLEAAIEAYDRALALQPDYARALNNRGFAESSRHNYKRALTDLDAALALDPNYVAAIVNRGIALQGLGQNAEALGCYRRAFPAAEALANASAILRDTNQGAEAYECSALLYRSAPDMDEAAGIYHSMSQNIAVWSDYQSRIETIVAGVRAGRRPAQPLTFLSVIDSPSDQLRCASLFAQKLGLEDPLWRGEIYRHDRIRIAYLSSDFGDHATTFLSIGMFERHDRDKFEIHALSHGKDPVSATTRARLLGAFEHFENVHALTTRQIAERVRQLEIDVLIDLKGYTSDSRVDVLAHRPAPIQVHYLGYPGTLGSEFVDYLIADRNVIPLQERQSYAEQIVYLPHCYQATDNRRIIDEHPWNRERAGLPRSGPVLCAFHQVYKLNPPVFDVWMRLLKRLPEASLWLLADDPAAKARLSEEAEARMVKSSRLVFAPRLPQAVHLARHTVADLFLDTWPYGAHTSASDALWAGLPVVALEGRGFAARVSSSIVRAAGFGELVAKSPAEYENLVYGLCTDHGRLGQLREKLTRTVRSSPLFDTAAFTRGIEAAYSAMWTTHRSGGQRRPIAVSA